MAFLVLLERLSPVERAVLLLHDIFELEHDEIAAVTGRSASACRKTLERARKKVSAGRRLLGASRAEHERLLGAFLRAATAGDVPALASLLAADAQLITDGGPEGRVIGHLRNLRRPLQGAQRVAAFIAARTQSVELSVEPRDLNGQPGLVFRRDGALFAALLLGVSGGKIERVFFHADLARLGHLGAAPAA
jgi:RNA polymerase sigma-70 factor (ECF subfamily)